MSGGTDGCQAGRPEGNGGGCRLGSRWVGDHRNDATDEGSSSAEILTPGTGRRSPSQPQKEGAADGLLVGVRSTPKRGPIQASKPPQKGRPLRKRPRESLSAGLSKSNR